MPLDLDQGLCLSDVIKSELGNCGSRELVAVLAAQNLGLGAVLGKITIGTVPTTGTLTAGGSADGTMTSVIGGKNTQVGTYTATCTLAAAHGGTFTVADPNGKNIGECFVTGGGGGVGAFTSDEINFTLTDGSTDFAKGDYFSVVVPAGGGQVRALNVSGVDGSANAYGILAVAVDASASGEYTRTFTSGGTYEILPGDTITGATSAQTARVIAVTLTSGTWADGNAAGTLTLDTVSGTFQSENLNVGGNSNVATIAGDLSATAAADKSGVAIVRTCEITSTNLVWPSGTTTAQKATALAELLAKGIVARTQG